MYALLGIRRSKCLYNSKDLLKANEKWIYVVISKGGKLFKNSANWICTNSQNNVIQGFAFNNIQNIRELNSDIFLTPIKYTFIPVAFIRITNFAKRWQSLMALWPKPV